MGSEKRARQRANVLRAVSDQPAGTTRRSKRVRNPRHLKERYARAGAAALERVTGAVDVYVCPICFWNADLRDANDARKLTLEHAPPERLGGKAITVTCRKCNNSFGSGPDAAAARLEHFRDYFKSVPGSRVSGGRALTRSGMQVKVQARVGPDGSHEAIPVGPPADVEAFRRAIDDEGGFAVVHPIVDFDEQAALSHLKSAYLVVFAKLGYTWAMCDRVAPVRHLLSGRFASDVDAMKLVNGSRSAPQRRILVGGAPLFGYVVQFDEFVSFLPSHATPPDYVDRIAEIASSDAEVAFEGWYEFPESMEMHLDLEHLPDCGGPFLGIFDDDGVERGIAVEACELMAADQSERFIRFQKAPFRATRVLDGPDGAVYGLSTEDYEKHVAPEEPDAIPDPCD